MDPGPTTPTAHSPRLPYIDILRGLVIILMALDHARDYFAPFPHQPEDLAHASPALFLTRWITHFCAPAFVFLAGVSIFLKQSRNAPPSPTAAGPPALSRFLLTRGLWLIALELTLIAASWGFLFVGVLTFQVIWALGVSMIVMAALVRLPWQASLAFGAILIAAHNLLDPITIAWLHARDLSPLTPLWAILHEQAFISFDPTADQPFTPPGIFVVYPLIPWIGVMPLGYAFGRVMTLPAPRRDRWCLILGAATVLAFLLLRATSAYGDPSPRSDQPDNHPILAFLNTTKYPPSLQFLLMTLGPALLLLPLLERLRGPVASFLLTFGRTPLFFYLLHIPLLHLTSAVFWYARHGVMTGWQVNPATFPAAYVPNLALAYLATALAVAILYFPCRWLAHLKQRRRDWWLSYL